MLGFFQGKDTEKQSHKVPIKETDYDVINKLADEFYATSTEKGFHSGPAIVGNFVSNLHSETSEFWEAYRNNTLYKPCDKADKMEALGIAPLNCGEEELADVFIRTLDTAKALEINIGRAIKLKHQFNQTRSFRHGNKAA